MNKYFFSLLFVILFSFPVFACLNGEQMVLANKELLYIDHESEIPYGHEWGNKEQLEEFLVDLDKGYKETKELDYLSDRGYILIILGRYQEAIDLYKRIESIESGRYSTASNIGTAYELIGNNTEALKWIEKAVKIDPKSHSSSEWIHINILKAKIKGDKNVTSKELIGYDFGSESSPKSNLSMNELRNLKLQIYYQLNERISFVKPKDKIVAQLLFDLANIAFLTNAKSEAKDDYEMAKEYGFENSILEERMKLDFSKNLNPVMKSKPSEIINDKEEADSHVMETIISIVALLFASLIVFIFRKKVALMLK